MSLRLDSLLKSLLIFASRAPATCFIKVDVWWKDIWLSTYLSSSSSSLSSSSSSSSYCHCYEYDHATDYSFSVSYRPCCILSFLYFSHRLEYFADVDFAVLVPENHATSYTSSVWPEWRSQINHLTTNMFLNISLFPWRTFWSAVNR